MTRLACLLTAVLVLAPGALLAQRPAGDGARDRQDIRADRRDLRHDRRDVRSDKRDIVNDRRDVRSDRRDLAGDARDIRSDRAEGGLRTVLKLQRVGSQRYFDAAGFPGRTVGLDAVSAKQKTAGK